LRDGGTTKKLAIVIPADEVHRLLPETITQLEVSPSCSLINSQQSFDYVIPMPTLASTNRANLRLLERPDLALTLTKIHLWRLTQFRKCVYLDADILALRAPDELFNLDVDFAVSFNKQVDL
jgi:glycogenin